MCYTLLYFVINQHIVSNGNYFTISNVRLIESDLNCHFINFTTIEKSTY